jgi:hypothetical protein
MLYYKGAISNKSIIVLQIPEMAIRMHQLGTDIRYLLRGDFLAAYKDFQKAFRDFQFTLYNVGHTLKAKTKELNDGLDQHARTIVVMVGTDRERDMWMICILFSPPIPPCSHDQVLHDKRIAQFTCRLSLLAFDGRNTQWQYVLAQEARLLESDGTTVIQVSGCSLVKATTPDSFKPLHHIDLRFLSHSAGGLCLHHLGISIRGGGSANVYQ